MNESQAVLLALLDRFFVGFVVIGAVQHDLGAIGAGGRDFGERRRERHHNARVDRMTPRMVGNPLRMIARRCCDYATGAFILVQREQLVQRAPFFESSGALLVIELEEDGIVGQPRKCFRVGAGGYADVRANSVERGLDVGKLNHRAVILLHSISRSRPGSIFEWIAQENGLPWNRPPET